MNIVLAKFAFSRIIAGTTDKQSGFCNRWRIWHIGKQLASIARMHGATRSAHVNVMMQDGHIGTLRQVMELGRELAQLQIDHDVLLRLEDRNRQNVARSDGQPEGRLYAKEAQTFKADHERVMQRYAMLRRFALQQGFDVPELLQAR